jgi:hypothetical protein
MKAPIRTHPKLKYQGARMWPPDWSGGYDGGLRYPRGEEGTLEDVDIAEKDLIGPRRLDLYVKHEGRTYGGQVWVDDPTLVPKLVDILKQHAGSPIRQISDLEVDL